MTQGGSGSESCFLPRAAEDVPGVRLTAKICELCSANFFRDAEQRYCPRCDRRMQTKSEPVRMTRMERVAELRRKRMALAKRTLSPIHGAQINRGENT